MTQGARTPDSVRLEFAAEYLRTGSPRQAAKAVGLPSRTGYDIAAEFDECPEFAKRRAALHARVLDRAEAACERAIDVLSERIENATELLGNEEMGIKVLDKAADYGRAISSLTDSLLKRRKLEDDVAARLEGKGEGAGPVEVTIKLTQDKAPSGAQD